MLFHRGNRVTRKAAEITKLDLPEVPFLDRVPTLDEIVNTQFAFSKKVLTNQEKFAKNVVKAVKPLTRDAKPKAKAEPKAETPAEDTETDSDGKEDA